MANKRKIMLAIIISLIIVAFILITVLTGRNTEEIREHNIEGKVNVEKDIDSTYMGDDSKDIDVTAEAFFINDKEAREMLKDKYSSTVAHFSNYEKGIFELIATDGDGAIYAKMDGADTIYHIRLVEKSYEMEIYETGTVPYFYMQDYQSTPYNGRTLAECGNQIVALSMIESYLNETIITPEDFIKRHKDDISNDLCNINKIGANISPQGTSFTSEAFNYKSLCSHLAKGAVVLVRITHPSMYGQDSCYIIITGITDSEHFEIRDPNKENVDRYCDEGDIKTQYYIADVLTAAGKDSVMYVFEEDLNDEE